MDLKEIDVLGDSLEDHFYYISKGKALSSILRKYSFSHILDIGAGSGIFSKQLLSSGLFHSAVCLDTGYSHEYTEVYKGYPMTFLKSIDSLNQDLVLMMDVLEHIPNDLEFLSYYVSQMKSGTKILITVPAFQFLWSDHDLFLDHQRRYNILSLKSLLQNSGLKEIRMRYFFGILFPLVSLLRLLKPKTSTPKSELKNYHPLINKLLILIHDCERLILFPLNFCAGLTLFCLAEKP